jgi:acetyl-CoA carboxylase biotin carboxyl carrier protein
MQFGLNEILTVIDKVRDTGLAAFEYQDADTKIKIKGTSITDGMSEKKETFTCEKAVPAAPVMEQKISDAAAADRQQILSPMVGTFYAAPSEEAEPFVKPGDIVKKGQVVAIVEAMKLMNEIEAECDGVVVEVLVQNEQTVEFGQPLFAISQEVSANA